jgi:hypothetical protein
MHDILQIIYEFSIIITRMTSIILGFLILVLIPVMLINPFIQLFKLFDGNIVINNKKWIVMLNSAFHLLLPFLFFKINSDQTYNGCCGFTAPYFSTLNINSLLILYLVINILFTIGSARKSLLPPILEFSIQSSIILGIILCLATSAHIGNILYLYTIPMMVNYFVILIKRNLLIAENFKRYSQVGDLKFLPRLFNLFQSNIWYRIVFIILFTIPLLTIYFVILYVFGQKPSSLIEAFTQTYTHGFSELTYNCSEVECPSSGMFLCTIGSYGHKSIVRPVRFGERNNFKIVCTRQLLISNAFEETIQDNFPRIHYFFRSLYNKLGALLGTYSNVFENKYICDIVYLAFKPMEYLFLLWLYCTKNNPEDLINLQYIKTRASINMQ